MANILYRTNSDIDKIWQIIREISFLAVSNCKSNNNIVENQLKTIEKQLELETTYTNFANITNEILEKAAKMYIYMDICPGKDYSEQWFKSWSIFYIDLFENQKIDHIILTLNRMMKSNKTQSKNGKIMTEKLFKMATKLLQLKYEEIQRVIPG